MRFLYWRGRGVKGRGAARCQAYFTCCWWPNPKHSYQGTVRWNKWFFLLWAVVRDLGTGCKPLLLQGSTNLSNPALERIFADHPNQTVAAWFDLSFGACFLLLGVLKSQATWLSLQEASFTLEEKVWLCSVTVLFCCLPASPQYFSTFLFYFIFLIFFYLVSFSRIWVDRS